MFVYLGTRIVEFYIDLSDEYLRNLITWNDNITPSETLKMAGLAAYTSVQSDLKSIRSHFCSMKMGDFQKVNCSEIGQEDYEHLYIYRFTEHLIYSNTTTTKMARLCPISEQQNFQFACCKHPCHESYYPYFYSNSQCEHLFDELRKNSGNIELPDLHLFGNQKSAGSFSEDEWTERLHACLKLNNIKAELTAHYRNYNVSKSWEQRLPASVDKRCLLFQGSPDMIILTEDRMEGILNTDSVEQEEDVNEEADTSPCSQVSGRFQIGHQMTKSNPYLPESFLPDKAGELMAALHTSLVCRTLRRYTKKKEVNSLTAHGLHIHRTVGITHVEVTLSKNRIQISTQHSLLMASYHQTFFVEQSNTL